MKADVRVDYPAAALWHDRPESWREVLPGVRRRILARSLTGMMVLYRIDPGTVFPRHNHPHAQYGTFLEGGGMFRVGETTWKLVKGDAYYVPPGIFHELKTDEGQQSVILDFFTPEREDYKTESPSPDPS